VRGGAGRAGQAEGREEAQGHQAVRAPRGLVRPGALPLAHRLAATAYGCGLQVCRSLPWAGWTATGQLGCSWCWLWPPLTANPPLTAPPPSDFLPPRPTHFLEFSTMEAADAGVDVEDQFA
jgi:hypothetical protein